MRYLKSDMKHLKNVPILIFANKQDLKGAHGEE